jgi:hypothetical protein
VRGSISGVGVGHTAKSEATVPQGISINARQPTLSSVDKIALFRLLFRGRDDVFPRRWENAKSGKSGYAPACHNEWIRGICEKPRIKCSNCPNQAFVPVSDAISRSHLQGRDVTVSGRAGPSSLVFIRCWLTRPAGSLLPILTSSHGSAMHWRFWELAVRKVCPQLLNAPALAMALMFGFSFLNL